MGIPKAQWKNCDRPSENDSPENIERCGNCKFKDCKFDSLTACLKHEAKIKEMEENNANERAATSG